MKEKQRKRRGRGGNGRWISNHVNAKRKKKKLLAQTVMHSQYTLSTDVVL